MSKPRPPSPAETMGRPPSSGSDVAPSAPGPSAAAPSPAGPGAGPGGRPPGVELAFATPRKLPKAHDLRGRVVVLDVAFASEVSGGGFDKITRPFIDGLGARL